MDARVRLLYITYLIKSESVNWWIGSLANRATCSSETEGEGAGLDHGLVCVVIAREFEKLL